VRRRLKLLVRRDKPAFAPPLLRARASDVSPPVHHQRRRFTFVANPARVSQDATSRLLVPNLVHARFLSRGGRIALRVSATRSDGQAILLRLSCGAQATCP
jgi:ribosomal protein L28